LPTITRFFKLEVDEKAEKIFILVKDLTTDKIIDNSIYYTFANLKQIIETKWSNGLMIKWFNDYMV